MAEGKFIVFEGLDGSGQSTQAEKLKSFLKTKGLRVLLTKEPTCSLIGGLIKSQLKGDWNSSPECLQLLFSADRAYHLEKEVYPWLEKGGIVISDRYFFSSLAYGGISLDLNWLKAINQNFKIPDLTIFLDVSPKECLKRIKGDRESLELFEKEEILNQVYQNYLKILKDFPNTFRIDGERDKEEVFEEVKLLVSKHLNI